MITKPTVFVLGAGTSMPYGFPSGGQLVREICGATGVIPFEDEKPGLLDKGDIAQVLRFFGVQKTEEFGKDLHYSQRYSIDAFLERRPEYMDIGKWAIALLIARQEIEANLFGIQNQDRGCYRYLFERMVTGWDEFRENKISFLTFNYDRSLEHFLFTTIQKTFGKSDEECAELLTQIPIVHLHGSLGKLPWQNKNGLPFGANLDKYEDKAGIANATANIASKQIKVIPENQSASDEFDQAFKLLTEAERIYFLGFGYHSTNLKRLKVDKLSKEERIRKRSDSRQSRMLGTGLGLEAKELGVVKEDWFIYIPDAALDSLLFLRRYADLV